MTFNAGTGITDHIAMFDKLIEVVTGRFMDTAVINAGGTGHAIGDIITIDNTGATQTETAQIEVLTLSGSAIATLRIFRGGVYTVDPTTTTGNAQSATTGAGTGATFDITFSAPTWSLNRRTKQTVVALPTITAAGTGYSVSDVLTPSGTVLGDGGSAPTYTVATVGGSGEVSTITRTTGGNMEETPANPAVTTVSPSGGTGCTLTITYENPVFSDTTAQVAMLEGEGLAGTDEIHVMIKTYELVIAFDTAYNWSLLGATGYNNTIPIHQQTGVNADQINTSTGALPGTDVGAYLVLKNNDADPDIEWWINHNGRRIILVCKVQGSSNVQYSSCYLGFLNQLATDTEYPYPLWIGGQTNDKDRLWTETSLLTGGIVESIANNSGDPNGPGFLRLPAGTWLSHTAENSLSASLRAVETEFGIYPFLAATQLAGASQTVSLNSDVGFAQGIHSIIPASGQPATETMLLKPTTGTGSDFYWLVTPFVVRQENAGGNPFPDFFNMWGEIDGVFWFHRGGTTVVSEDRFELTTRRYTIFQNGNRTENWSFFALDED